MYHAAQRPALTADWLEQARGANLVAVAQALGVELKRSPGSRQWAGCCPLHTEKTPSFLVHPEKQQWFCHGACHVGGDGLDLVARMLCGARLADLKGNREALGKVRDWYASRGWCDRDDGKRAPRRRPPAAPAQPRAEQPRARPPAAEVQALWDACGRVDPTLVEPTKADMALAVFLSRRRLWAPTVASLDLARALPEDYAWPGWWPRSWAQTWRLVVPAYEVDGTLAAIHARAVTPDAEPRQRWPYCSPFGYSCAGLLLADPRGRALLRGEATDLQGVVVCEGVTDMIAAACELANAGRPLAVLSVTSGSASALARVPWPKGLPVTIATDPDKAGDGYAEKLRAAIPIAVDVRRWRSPLFGADAPEQEEPTDGEG